MKTSLSVFARTLQIAGLCAAAASVGTAHGAFVSSIGSPTGPGLGSAGSTNLVTGAEGNNDYTGPGGQNPNQIGLAKTFDAVDYIDLIFTVGSNIPDVTEYWVTDAVTNNTSETWYDFHIELLVFSGGSLIPSPDGDALDFDQEGPNPSPISDTWALWDITLDPDKLDFFHGKCVPGATCTMQFALDVPEGLEGNQFVMRQTPTVPAPATIALLGLGALAFGVSHRRRR